MRSLTGHTETVICLAFSPDGRTLASAADNTIRFWSVADGELLNTFKSGHVESVAYGPDGNTLASASDSIRISSITDGTVLHTLEGDRLQHGGGFSSVAINADGQLLASGSHFGTVHLWTLADGKLQRRLSRTVVETKVAFSPDGSTLVIGGFQITGRRQHAVRLWSVVDGRWLGEFEEHPSNVIDVAFSADGRTIAAARSDGVGIWARPGAK